MLSTASREYRRNCIIHNWALKHGLESWNRSREVWSPSVAWVKEHATLYFAANDYASLCQGEVISDDSALLL